MNRIVENLLRLPDPPKIFCVVVKPLGRLRYQVEDSSGRQLAVDAAVSWSVNSGVTVVEGRIVGPATKFINPKTYEV